MRSANEKKNTVQNSELESEGLSSCVQRILFAYFEAHGNELPAPGLYERIVREVEKPLLLETLKRVEGNQKKAAVLLGMSRNTLRKRLATLCIDSNVLEQT